MAKKSGSNFFLEKGEKLAIGLGVTGLVGFLIWGVMSFSAAEDPKAIEDKIKKTTQNVQTRVNGQGQPAPKLPEWVDKKAEFTPVSARDYAMVASPFEPISQPDMLRENPRVLGITQWQLDVIRGPMRALDIDIGRDGETLVGVLTTRKVAEKDLVKFRDGLKNLTPRLPGKNPPRFNPKLPNRPNPGPGTVARPGAPEGDPYGTGSNAAGPSGQRSEDKAVEYMTLEEAGKKGLPLAETIIPMRMVVVSAAFPVKAQLEEIQRALRLQSVADAALESTGGTAAGVVGGAPPVGGPVVAGPGIPGAVKGPGTGQAPIFDGFDVERRVIPAGTPPEELEKQEWVPFDHLGEYWKIRSRMLETQPDEGYLPYFVRYEQKMTAPLPKLISGLAEYPPIRLPAIVDAVAKLREAQKPVLTPSDLEKRFGKPAGDVNPFAPVGANSGVTGNFGDPKQPPVFDPKKDPKNDQGVTDVDTMMIRFLDPTVDSGYSYQYRIRVRMKNPNFGKDDKVREKSEAKKEFLEGSWVAIPDLAVLPPDNHLYAYDPDKYLESAKVAVEDVLTNVPAGKRGAAIFNMNTLLHFKEIQNGKQAVVQFQTWMPKVLATGNKSEPVGTWVLAEIPVAVGEYIGKRTLVKLPLWSSSLSNYVLRELGGGIKIFGIPADSQPKGWAVPFKTKLILVDFEGGKPTEKVGNKTISDTASTELLILRTDGKLMLKNSGRDMADEEREKRNSDWEKWIADVKDRKEGGTGTGPNTGIFRRD